MLEICKASAGSGKTYKLTEEYVSKLLGSDSNDRFRHIQAVTFTNKATDEMKRRILERLYEISVSKTDARSEKARDVLVELLNDYSAFNVSTIDRFFQQVLRAFARETGNYSSYNLSLEQDTILSESVDALMDSLGDNQLLLDWLIKLSVDAIESGGGWNPIPKVTELGKELFSEDYKIQSRKIKGELENKDFIAGYRSIMMTLISSFEMRSKELGVRGVEMIARYNLSASDFTGGSRSPFNAFAKWSIGVVEPPKVSFTNLLDGVEKWYSKNAPGTIVSVIKDAYDAGLSNVVENICSHYNNGYRDYLSAKAIVENLYTLGILFDINSKINEYCKKKNIVLISQTNDFLNRIIDGSDTPFIYEKIGGKIDSYMLDEFQDTSLMQWENFKPLVKDSLSENNDNLIVGDVKQSIYRWRNSDWNLLKSVVYKDIDRKYINDTLLGENWRSARNVVEFNNIFFTYAAPVLQQKYNDTFGEGSTLITDIYSQFKQTSARKGDGEGHISVSFIPRVQEEGGDDWRTAALAKIPQTIQRLTASGYGLNDIAILVRANAEGALVANHLLNEGYKIISEDSLLISSSESVQTIVTTLKYMANPNDPVGKYLFKDGMIETKEKSLFSICEDIARNISGNENESGAFIQAFMDCVSDYVSINGSDISGFVRWWDDVGRGRSISAPEGENAVRIITIHKSKGLGFNVVIMPFLYGEFYREHGEVLWCRPQGKPFDNLNLIPILSGSSLKDTIFAPKYKEEVLYSYIDCLNISYVAFTRAKEELVIYSPIPKMKKDGTYSISSMADVLYSYCAGSLDENSEYSLGDWAEYFKPEEKVKEEDIFFKDGGKYISVPIDGRLHLSYSGGDFLDETSKRMRGVLMHGILSEISVAEDLEKALKNAVSDGRILQDDYQEIFGILSSKLSFVADRHWFDGTYRHHNESAIIDARGETLRPDRVMVAGDEAIVLDYKFGQREERYREQVLGYVSLMKGMGYKNVSGYIWYLNENNVEQV